MVATIASDLDELHMKYVFMPAGITLTFAEAENPFKDANGNTVDDEDSHSGYLMKKMVSVLQNKKFLRTLLEPHKQPMSVG